MKISPLSSKFINYPSRKKLKLLLKALNKSHDSYEYFFLCNIIPPSASTIQLILDSPFTNTQLALLLRKARKTKTLLKLESIIQKPWCYHNTTPTICPEKATFISIDKYFNSQLKQLKSERASTLSQLSFINYRINALKSRYTSVKSIIQI